MPEKEIWKWVHKLSSFEGVKPVYEVSNLGSIRSWLDSRGRIKELDPKILTGQMNGYPHVGLRRIDGGTIGAHVHSIVALAFIGPRPKGASIRHLNDDRTDNFVSNLAYGSHQENALDRVKNQKSRAKVSESDVGKIRQRAHKGEGYLKIAKDFNVSQSTVGRIALGISFSYLNTKFPPLRSRARSLHHDNPDPWAWYRPRVGKPKLLGSNETNQDWRPLSPAFIKYRDADPSVFGQKYQVSENGNVRNEHDTELKPQLVRGYVYYQLYFGEKQKFCQAHQLVAWTFIGPPPEGTDRIRHLDGNPKNNFFKNLAWGNAASNAADIDPDKRGRRTPALRILEDQTLKLKKMGHTKKEIRNLLGLSAQRVQRYLKNAEEREWERIEENLDKRWQNLILGKHTNLDNR